jgi:hypothetical protein
MYESGVFGLVKRVKKKTIMFFVCLRLLLLPV